MIKFYVLAALGAMASAAADSYLILFLSIAIIFLLMQMERDQ
jgi:hypothetical protein